MIKELLDYAAGREGGKAVPKTRLHHQARAQEITNIFTAPGALQTRSTQRLQNPLIKEYTLNHMRVPINRLRYIP